MALNNLRNMACLLSDRVGKILQAECSGFRERCQIFRRLISGSLFSGKFAEDPEEEDEDDDETDPGKEQERIGEGGWCEDDRKEIAVPGTSRDGRTEPHRNEVPIHENGIDIDGEEKRELEPERLVGEDRSVGESEKHHPPNDR